MSAKAAARKATAVFLGTATEIEERTEVYKGADGQNRSALRRAVTVHATEAWKGVAKPEVVVIAGNGTDCDFPFEKGERYLVLAYRPTTGAGLITGQCSYTLWRGAIGNSTGSATGNAAGRSNGE